MATDFHRDLTRRGLIHRHLLNIIQRIHAAHRLVRRVLRVEDPREHRFTPDLNGQIKVVYQRRLAVRVVLHHHGIYPRQHHAELLDPRGHLYLMPK